MMPHIGKPAPAFELPDQDGVLHSLKEYQGKWLLLYFYPKDDTSGCTTEACNFRDGFANYKERGITIVGVSVDPVKSHKKFAEKYQLPFTLLADEEKKTVEDYGVWVEKSMYGKSYMGIARTTFLIDPKGVIAKVYEKVKPEEHHTQILADLAVKEG
jgi:peroxiredoxin Q/BCP